MKKNIVLIGLSGCGKSTIGAALADRLHLPVTDMDAYIEAKEGMTISQIFDEKGEPYFRQLEAEAAKELSFSTGSIIATGGGVILNPDNMMYLQKTGVIVFLDRTPEAILKDIDTHKRPLLAQDKNRLLEQDRIRRPLYEKYADITVSDCCSVCQTLSALLSSLRPYVQVSHRHKQPAGHRYRPRYR